MSENERKIRLSASSSVVWRLAGPPGLTLRARWIFLVRALQRLENRKVSCTYVPAHKENPAAQIACFF